jgi:hypothetical protein
VRDFSAVFCGCSAERKSDRVRRAVKYWEIIADNLHKAGFSLGYVSALDRKGRTIWIVDAHGYGNRFIVRADELLTAFVELQQAIHGVRGEFDVVITLHHSLKSARARAS